MIVTGEQNCQECGLGAAGMAYFLRLEAENAVRREITQAMAGYDCELSSDENDYICAFCEARESVFARPSKPVTLPYVSDFVHTAECPVTKARALLAGIGVGLCSSVIPYVTDQLAMARLPRATFALLLALLPACASVIGVLVLRQIPSLTEIAGVALIVAGVAMHRERDVTSGAEAAILSTSPSVSAVEPKATIP